MGQLSLQKLVKALKQHQKTMKNWIKDNRTSIVTIYSFAYPASTSVVVRIPLTEKSCR